MHVNPCGYGVEFLRRMYRTVARPFVGEEIETEIRWYPCAPGAAVLPFPTVYNSNLWNRFPWQKESPGEVFDAERLYAPRATVPDLPNGHHCGTDEELHYGEVFDPDAPPTVYGADGIPVCCRPDGGGVVLGGEAPTPAGDGGVLLGGEAIQPAEPGSDCASAGAVALGVPFSADHPGGLVVHWWTVAVTALTAYHVETLSGDAVNLTFNVWYGDSCAGLSFWGALTAIPECLDVTIPAGSRLWIEILAGIGGSGSYELVIAPGQC